MKRGRPCKLVALNLTYKTSKKLMSYVNSDLRQRCLPREVSWCEVKSDVVFRHIRCAARKDPNDHYCAMEVDSMGYIMEVGCFSSTLPLDPRLPRKSGAGVTQVVMERCC